MIRNLVFEYCSVNVVAVFGKRYFCKTFGDFVYAIAEKIVQLFIV